ncbi:hypothetical protein FRB90_010370 [Tulasnella sp. 427]|nr:hypothetical protein FRB90_010370 [Tulasnella sp. 427]
MSTSEATEWFSFGGAPEEKAATFIQSINRQAYAQGKARDDEWLAQYAAACLAEDALAWYYSLTEEVQNSWRKICPTLLKQFPSKVAETKAVFEADSDIIPAASPATAPSPVPASSNTPAPVPAALAPPSPTPPRARSPGQASTARMGPIELADAVTGSRMGYIDWTGNKLMTQDIKDAILIELPWAAGPSTPVSLRMINAQGTDRQRKYLGIFGVNNPFPWWTMTACVAGNTNCFVPNKLGRIFTMSNVWTVHPLADLLEIKILCPGQWAWEGDALGWYYNELGEEIQGSWRKLCAALLKEFGGKKLPPAPTASAAASADPYKELRSSMYSASEVGDAPRSTPALAPIPTAAPAPPAYALGPSFDYLPSSVQEVQQLSTSRIRYIELADAQTGGRMGYINSKGDKTITFNVNEALLVETPVNAKPGTLVSLRMVVGQLYQCGLRRL